MSQLFDILIEQAYQNTADNTMGLIESDSLLGHDYIMGTNSSTIHIGNVNELDNELEHLTQLFNALGATDITSALEKIKQLQWEIDLLQTMLADAHDSTLNGTNGFQ